MVVGVAGDVAGFAVLPDVVGHRRGRRRVPGDPAVPGVDRRQVRSPVVKAAVDAGLVARQRGERVDGGGDVDGGWFLARQSPLGVDGGSEGLVVSEVADFGQHVVKVAHLVSRGAVRAEEVVGKDVGVREVVDDASEAVEEGGVGRVSGETEGARGLLFKKQMGEAEIKKATRRRVA